MSYTEEFNKRFNAWLIRNPFKMEQEIRDAEFRIKRQVVHDIQVQNILDGIKS